MSEFLSFLQIGFAHIVGVDAADHILFLVVLSAIYRFRDWRRAIVVVSAFTVGHSMTLVLAVTGVLTLPPAVVEFLIPLTIVVAALENLIWRKRLDHERTVTMRPFIAGLFGLVHGAGFAGYLQSLFVDELAMPLLGFNVGIELGQVVVLALIFGVYAAWDQLAARDRAFQPRLVAVSLCGACIAAVWALERVPR
ncbi:MAG: HupE/UreJ family protein [Gemmatimonadaceae bacterium]|nr:HupE/UreJ family protein [Gemmatimonadaceae bacterium]